jgi:hypothetical protein
MLCIYLTVKSEVANRSINSPQGLWTKKEGTFMRINFLYKGVLVASALCLAPAALPASPKANQPGPLASVNEGAFPGDTGLLLQGIQTDALDVKNNADQLRALLRGGPLNDWQSDGYLLSEIREDVNEMNKQFSQLRTQKAEISLSEQKVIHRTASTAVNLADTTEEALVTLNHNQSHVYMTDLGGLANDMYNQAGLIEQVVGNLQKYADARHEVRQLRQTLGLKSSS